MSAAEDACAPTWDRATDGQILAEIRAMRATGRHVAFGSAVEALLRERGLWDAATGES